jgi:hypothetical protein
MGTDFPKMGQKVLIEYPGFTHPENPIIFSDPSYTEAEWIGYYDQGTYTAKSIIRGKEYIHYLGPYGPKSVYNCNIELLNEDPSGRPQSNDPTPLEGGRRGRRRKTKRTKRSRRRTYRK